MEQTTSSAAIVFPSNECSNCSQKFTSRNNLFKHLRTCTKNNDHEPLLGHKRKIDDRRLFVQSPTSQSQLQEICIIQEDEYWYRVVSKPQGMATMGEDSNSDAITLMNSNFMLLDDAMKKNLNYKKATPCHRLDRATGGLVVCSKSKEAESSIMTSFRNREVKKRYRAIVSGNISIDEGTIDFDISNQNAITLYRVVQRSRSHQYDWVTTVDLWPITGRKHQLRKHLSEFGHFIIGDQRYSYASDWPAAPYTHTLFLWSLEVSFPHKGQGKQGPNALNNNRIPPPLANFTINTEADPTSEIGPDFSVIKVVIPEPTYYEDFRKHQAELYVISSTNALRDTLDCKQST